MCCSRGCPMEASIPVLSETARPMGGTVLFWWVMDGVLVQLTSPVQNDSSVHDIIASFIVYIRNVPKTFSRAWLPNSSSRGRTAIRRWCTRTRCQLDHLWENHRLNVTGLQLLRTKDWFHHIIRMSKRFLKAGFERCDPGLQLEKTMYRTSLNTGRKLCILTWGWQGLPSFGWSAVIFPAF